MSTTTHDDDAATARRADTDGYLGATRADLLRLRDPLPPEDIEWRVQTAGEKNGKPWARVLAYVTNRAMMNRFDEVVGPENWRNEYREGPGGGILCGLSVRVFHPLNPEGEWVTKWDGAENTDVEAVKGGLSNAMKRAAVQWGIGRYLYELEEGWANVHDGGRFSARTKDGKWFKWDPPLLPEWAIPRPHAADAQVLAYIETLLPRVDAKVQAGVRRRLAAGMSRDQATECVRFLETHVVAVIDGARDAATKAAANVTNATATTANATPATPPTRARAR